MRRRLRRRYGHGLFSRRVDVMSTPRAQAVYSHLTAPRPGGWGLTSSKAETVIRRHASDLSSSVNPAHVALDLVTWEGLD